MSITIGVVKSATSSKKFIPFSLISANSTNVTLIKATAATLGSLVVIGLGINVTYLHFYDENVINPALEFVTPKFTFPVPTNESGAGISISFPEGVEFENGMIISTTSVTSDMKSPIEEGEMIINLTYN
jgi:hypothetical protein